MWQDQAWRCHLMPPSNINAPWAVLCTAEHTADTAPLPLLPLRGLGGSHSPSWALSGAGSSLLAPEQCGGLQQDGNRQVLHFFLLHGVPFPPKPVTEASEAAVSAASLALAKAATVGEAGRQPMPADTFASLMRLLPFKGF